MGTVLDGVADITPETGEAELKVMELARKRRQNCIEAETFNRTEAEEDIRFAWGDQWPDQIKTSRESEHRPCLTINKTGQYVRQVVNDSRQNTPAIKVFPVGGGADQDVAKVLNGLIRDIEQRSDARVAYNTSLETTARSGEGFFRIRSVYESDETFEQRLAFFRVRNPNTIHLDPAAQCPAGSDSRYGFVDQWLPSDELKEQYGDEALHGLDTQGLGEHATNWINGDNVLIAEYYTVEKGQKRTLALLKTGAQVILEEQSDPVPEAEIVAQRPVQVERVIWRKITGNKVLEKTVWPCRYIPIFRVIGEEFEVDGKVYHQGLIRPMKDSQRMYNYWMTNATEKGALETKAPYIGAEGQFEGHETQWKNANNVPYAYLEYKMAELEGHLAPPPQRNQSTFAGQSDVAMAGLSSDDMKSTTGIYDAGLGAKSNEQSGKAILARQRESDVGTFHYVDNLAIALKHAGKVLVEVIPKIYNSQRVVRILGEDDSEQMVTINEQKQVDGADKVLNDITVGRYDVRVAVGPSFTTRRIEAAETMMEFVRNVPAAGEAIMDLVAKSMDWPGSEEIAERLRRMVPPNLLDSEDDDGEGFTPTQMEQAVMEAVGNLKQQFEQSVANREVEVKEFEAQTDRLAKLADKMPDEGQLRDMVGKMIAEFVQQMGSMAESA